LFFVFICQNRLEGTTMEIQFDDIGGGKRLLRQIGEEEFVDEARTRNANRTLLLANGMGRYHHAARHTERSHRYLRTIVEAAHDLTFRTLLELIRGQVQTRLDERMIEHRVLFAARYKGETSQVCQHGPRAILAIEP
jgi:hypothetical protein